MNIKLWIVTAVDYGETCDGKARVLEICKSKEEAKAFVHADIEKWADDHASENIEVDFDKMNAYIPSWGYGVDTGCEWNIDEYTLGVTEDDEQAAAIDDGQFELDSKEV